METNTVEEQMKEAENTGFDQEMILEFHRSGDKLLTRYKVGNSTGKYIFPNRTEDLAEITEGMPYRCMVKETETAGFAKIINRVFIPRIIIRKGFVIATIREKGDIKHLAFPTLYAAMQRMFEMDIYKWIISIQQEDFKDYEGVFEIDLFKVWSGDK